MTNPKFSIITPTYNRAYVLWKTILGIQQQAYSNWELIIIDDGSTDDTKKLLAEFQGDPRIKPHYQKNQGASAARNTGLEKAIGEIVLYLDSDDEPYPHLLSTLFFSLSQNKNKNYGICNHNRSLEQLNSSYHIQNYRIDPIGQNQQITLEHFYDWKVHTTASGLFHRREPFLQKAFWKSEIYIEDLEFIMQLAVLDEPGFLHIPQSLFHYRQQYGGNGLCSQASYETYARSFGQIYEWHKQDPLMKNPHVYLDRVQKYNDLQTQYLKGEIPPLGHKYFS
jgi:glycosyltransferase involved in cell wall biosynthesis